MQWGGDYNGSRCSNAGGDGGRHDNTDVGAVVIMVMSRHGNGGGDVNGDPCSDWVVMMLRCGDHGNGDDNNGGRYRCC